MQWFLQIFGKMRRVGNIQPSARVPALPSNSPTPKSVPRSNPSASKATKAVMSVAPEFLPGFADDGQSKDTVSPKKRSAEFMDEISDSQSIAG